MDASERRVGEEEAMKQMGNMLLPRMEGGMCMVNMERERERERERGEGERKGDTGQPATERA